MLFLYDAPPPHLEARSRALHPLLSIRIPRSGQLRRRREQQQLRSTSRPPWRQPTAVEVRPVAVLRPHIVARSSSAATPHLEYHGLLARRPIEAPITSGGAVHARPALSPLDRALSKIAHPQHATRPVPVSMCGTTTSQTTLMPAPALCPRDESPWYAVSPPHHAD